MVFFLHLERGTEEDPGPFSDYLMDVREKAAGGEPAVEAEGVSGAAGAGLGVDG